MINFAPCILFTASIACISGESSMKQKLFEKSLRTTVQLEEAPSTKFSIMERMDHYKVPAASVAVIDNGKLEWAKGYGFADERHTRAVDEHTLFQAGSISKSLTAFGALLLVEQGKLSLDRDVNTYLSRWKVQENAFTKNSKVTLRRLLSHTAGTSISGFPGYPEGSTLPSLIDVLEGNKPSANTGAVTVREEPGSRYQYSGGGTTIVQLMIEEVTQEPFDKWMKSNVLLPLGMRESTFAQPIPNELKDKTLSGHHLGGIPVEGEHHAYPEMGAAGLWTTPADLAQFILYIQQALEGKRTDLLSAETVREMVTRQRTSGGTVIESGLGVFLDVDGCALRFGHKGQNEGFIAELTGYGSLGKGAVVMVNNDSGWFFIGEVINAIADVYRWPGFKKIMRQNEPMKPDSLQKLAGKYSHEEEVIEVCLENGELLIDFNNGLPPVTLYSSGEGNFFILQDDLRINRTDNGLILINHKQEKTAYQKL